MALTSMAVTRFYGEPQTRPAVKAVVASIGCRWMTAVTCESHTKNASCLSGEKSKDRRLYSIIVQLSLNILDAFEVRKCGKSCLNVMFVLST